MRPWRSGISAAAFGGAAGTARRRTVAHMVSHGYLVALRLRSPACGGTRWCSAACRPRRETRWRFGGPWHAAPGSIRWRCAVALGCPRCTQWHSVSQGGSQCTRRYAPATLGARRRVGTRRYSAVLGVARGWARARAAACIVTLVGAQWCSCRSAASGTRRHSVARDGARWHESWHSATLCSARWSSAAAVERGGMRHAASRSDTARRRSAALCSARWHSAALGGSGGMRRAASRGNAARRRSVALLQRTVAQRHAVERGGMRQAASRSAHGGARWRADVCTLWHSMASGGARRPALACVAVSAHVKSAGWALAALQRRSALDRRCWRGSQRSTQRRPVVLGSTGELCATQCKG